MSYASVVCSSVGVFSRKSVVICALITWLFSLVVSVVVGAIFSFSIFAHVYDLKVFFEKWVVGAFVGNGTAWNLPTSVIINS